MGLRIYVIRLLQAVSEYTWPITIIIITNNSCFCRTDPCFHGLVVCFTCYSINRIAFCSVFPPRIAGVQGSHFAQQSFSDFSAYLPCGCSVSRKQTIWSLGFTMVMRPCPPLESWSQAQAGLSSGCLCFRLLWGYLWAKLPWKELNILKLFYCLDQAIIIQIFWLLDLKKDKDGYFEPPSLIPRIILTLHVHKYKLLNEICTDIICKYLLSEDC